MLRGDVTQRTFYGRHTMGHTTAQSASNPAQTYEDFFVTHQFGPWAGELLDRALPQPGERILDLACGTGIVARLAARRLNGQAQITGLDLSPDMLDVARTAAAREGAEIVWQEGRAEALPFSDASFDLVLCQQGFQFFPDRVAAAREVRRILVPGGRVATTTWTGIERNPLSQMVSEVLQRRTGLAAMDAPFALGGRDELRSVFTGAGFADVEIEVVRRTVRFPSPDLFLARFVTARTAGIAALQAISAEERATLITAVSADMAEPLRQYIDGDEVVYPTEAHILVGRG